MGHPHWNIFEWDHADRKNGNVQHLRDHGIEPHEAEECFFHEFDYTRDYRRIDKVYLLDGRTNRGRKLTIVFQDKGNSVVRVVTGWDLSSKKKR
jgi:uncharacterized DUF497 family protein